MKETNKKILKNIPEKIVRERTQMAKKVLEALAKLFPKPSIALRYKTKWQLFVAVVLSAQCTDKKVNEVTEGLFKKYRTLRDYVKADRKEFERDIRSTGFYRNKTKNILSAAKTVQEKFGGILPKTMKEMLTIPGIGRKSANVILGNAYGAVEGIAVDTHVMRLSQVFGFTNHTDPRKIEQDLMAIIPRKDWFVITYRFIEYGRQYCPARKHDHEKKKCPLRRFYSPS